MPGLSYFPIIAALGISVSAAGFLMHPIVTGVGCLVAFFGIYGWAFEPADPD